MLRLTASWALMAFAMIAAAQPAQDKGKSDQHGDALPPGALARMGTLRWRHGDVVSFVAFTPDGKAVLTASQDNVVHLWDRETGKEIQRFEIKGTQPGIRPGGGMIGWGGAGASRFAVSQDVKLLAAILPNNVIQLWSVETGKEIRQFKGPQAFANTIVFAPDGKSLALRGFDRTIHLLDTDGKEIRQIKGKQPQGRVFILNGQPAGADGFAFAPDGKTIATSEMELNMQKTIVYVKVTDIQTGNEIRKIDAPAGISSIAYSPDGKILAFGSGNGVQLREADTGKEIREIDAKNGIAGLIFAPDNKTLAVKRRDHVVCLFEANTGKALHDLGDPVALPPGVNAAFFAFGMPEARDVAFSPDNKMLATGGGQTLRFWTVANGKEQALAGGHRAGVSAVVLAADGKTMISRGNDNVIRRWDAVNGKELGQFPEPKGTTSAMFAPDGKTVAFANTDGTIRLHAIADGKELHNLKGHLNGQASLAFSPNSKTLASRGNFDQMIRLYDVEKGNELKQITIPGEKQAGNPGGGFGGFAGATGQGLVFSPDGQTVAANVNANNFGMIRGQPPQGGASKLFFWDVATAKEVRQIILPANRVVTTLAYSPDARLLAAENTDQTVSLWEIASGKERALLGEPAKTQPGMPSTVFMVVNMYGQAAPVATTLAFSPDGSILAARGPDHAVRVWEVAYAKEAGLFKGHSGAINAVAFAPNGKTLASASADTTLLVWDLGTLKREPKAVAVELQDKQVETLWADLLGADAAKASASIQKLAAAPKQTASFLRAKLKPAVPVDVKKIDQWLADLNSGNFATRNQATKELEKLGDLAIPALKKVLTSQPTLETQRRIEPLLEKLTSGALTAEQVRIVRAIEVLEKLGNSEARQVLDALAQGAPGALQTRQAQTVLDRLAR